MKQINFAALDVATDITGSEFKTMDKREEFANMLYARVPGIASQALALKVYNSTGTIILSDEEEKLLLSVVDNAFVPLYIDAVKNGLQEVNTVK